MCITDLDSARAKTTSELEFVNCHLCGSDNSSFLFQARDCRYGCLAMFNIVKCRNCELIYLNPRPTAESMLKQYEEYYTPNEKTDKPKPSKLSRRSLKKIFGSLWYKIGGYYGVSEIPIKGKFLDIGCAQGDTLETARNMGADVYGVELNPKSVEICRSKGLNVQCGSVEDSGYLDNYFDTVWMSQVIEHLPSPKDSLREIRRILKPDGRLYILCPNAGSYLARFFGKYWHGWHVPFHFYAYTHDTITKLVTKCGFGVTSLSDTTPYHFFSVSLKSMLYGERHREPGKRFRLADSLLFGGAISLILRMLDLVLSRRGDCLRVVLTKNG